MLLDNLLKRKTHLMKLAILYTNSDMSKTNKIEIYPWRETGLNPSKMQQLRDRRSNDDKCKP